MYIITIGKGFFRTGNSLTVESLHEECSYRSNQGKEFFDKEGMKCVKDESHEVSSEEEK